MYNPDGKLTLPLLPEQYYYIPDSQIGAPRNYEFTPIVGSLFLNEPHTQEICQSTIGVANVLSYSP